MPKIGSTESPNTKNVVIWSPKVITKLFDKSISKRRKFLKDEGKSESRTYITEKTEYYIVFFTASGVWFIVVNLALKYLKFPFHRHKLEVFMIYFIPVLFLLIILVIIDYVFTFSKAKNK